MKKLLLLLACLFLVIFGKEAAAQPVKTIVGDYSVCKGDQETYSITPTPGITYSWTVSNGMINSSSNSAVSVTWTTAGVGEVEVSGVNAQGNEVEGGTANVLVNGPPFITSNVSITCGSQVPPPNPQPEPDSSVCIKVCKGSITEFYSNTLSAPDDWSVVGGTVLSNTGDTVTIEWTALGFGFIEVNTGPGVNCTGSHKRCVEVIPGPTAEFEIIPFSGSTSVDLCNNRVIQFKDLSTDNGGSSIISWQWDFGDGSSSTVQNPSYTYDATGNFTVTLTVENECHCKSVYTVDVSVQNSDQLILDCPAVACEDQETYYRIDPGSACQNFDWEVIGGSFTTPNQAIDEVGIVWDTVDNDGFGQILIYDVHCGSGCEGPTVFQIPVVKAIGEIKGPEQICEGSRYLYKLPRWPATEFNWTIDGSAGVLFASDQPNEIVVDATQGGSITLRCTYTNKLINCGGKALIEINVLPLATISGPREVCADSSYDFTLSNGYHGDWSLYSAKTGSLVHGGSGNTFNTSFNYLPGNYILDVSGPNFCIKQPFNIVALPKPEPPNAIVGPDTVCTGVPFSFNATTSDPETSFNWKIVGGTFSGGALTAAGGKVSATFTGSGPYQLKVWRKVRNGLGCVSDTLTKILLPEGSNPGITGNATACANTYAAYQASYTRGEAYEWSLLQPAMGTVNSGNGTSSASILWNSVAAPGAFADVVLQVRKCGLTLRDTFRVYIRSSAGLSIVGPTKVCRDEVVQFSLVGTTLGNFSSVEWDFGDGTTYYSTTDSTATHQFTEVSSNSINYKVKVTVTNPHGCNTTYFAEHDIRVDPAPVASISPRGPIRYCDEITPDSLYALVQSGVGATTDFEWYMNGQSMGVGTDPRFYYDEPGEYYCVVYGDNGCTDTTNIVVVYEDCDGGGDPDGCKKCSESYDVPIELSYTLNGCGQINIHASYDLATPGYTLDAETWEVDGDYVNYTTNLNEIDYVFDKAGNYRVYFTVCYSVDKDRRIDSICFSTAYIDVINPYQPNIKYEITCGPGGYEVTLLDHSNYHPNTPIDEYSFYINNMTTPLYSGPNTSFTTTLPPGTWNIKLRIEGSGKPPCELNDVLELPVFPEADFSFSFNGACKDYPIEFMNTGSSGPGLTYEWDFTNNVYSTLENSFRAFPSPGAKAVTLTVRNALGCENSITQNVNVSPNQLIADLDNNPDPAILCDGGVVTLSGSSSGTGNALSYVFQPDSFAVITHPNNDTTVLESGSYFVTLWDANMCYDHSTSAKVEFIPNPPASILGQEHVCEGDSIALIGDAGEGNYTYLWRRNGAFVSNSPNIKVPAGSAGVYTFELTVARSAPIPCSSSALHEVEVHEKPNPPSTSFAVQDCQPYTVRLTGSITGQQGAFFWSDGQQGAVVDVLKGGEYTLTFVNDWGCSSTEKVYVPKSPEEFIWIYPLGCYEICEDRARLEQWELPDPIIEFANWHLNDGLDNPWTYSSGSFSKPDIFLQGSLMPNGLTGIYTFTLETDDCDFTSRFFDLEKVNCDNCLLDVTPDPVQFTSGSNGCRNEVAININHNGPQAITVSLNAKYGILVPATVTVPPGGGMFTFEYIPGPSPGATDSLFATSSIYHGPPMQIDHCYDYDILQLPTPICSNNMWYKRAVAHVAGPEGEQTLINSFSLAPNPASQLVNVSYELQGWDENSRAQLEVYDIRGARMATYPLHAGKGVEELSTAPWRPAVYVVLLRVNGEVSDYGRLVVYR